MPGMPRQTLAAVAHGPRDYPVEELPVPDAAPGETFVELDIPV